MRGTQFAVTLVKPLQLAPQKSVQPMSSPVTWSQYAGSFDDPQSSPTLLMNGVCADALPTTPTRIRRRASTFTAFIQASYRLRVEVHACSTASVVTAPRHTFSTVPSPLTSTVLGTCSM